ncbi:MAG: DUF86 domain-containing protein [Burkholderiales bacterium]|nr:DUF86 domain-containing protein [Burkholderiales bacterium]
MQPKTPKLLEDVRDAAAFIREATRGKTQEHYRGERLLRQAIERNFEIIGEAVNRLAVHDPETAGRITKHRRIVDFRNLLTHGYDLVDWCPMVTGASGKRRRPARCGTGDAGP